MVENAVTEREPGQLPDGDAALEAHRAQRRGLYNAFGTAWSSAFEVALAPLIVGAAGYGLDRWLGIFPVLTLVFFLIGAIGAGVKLYYGYRHRMEIEEANRPWAPQHPDWAAEEDK